MQASAALIVTLMLLCPSAAWGQQARDKLTALVRQDCGSCHGLTLKGGLGPALLPQNLAGQDEDAIASIILGGVPGTPMPPWRDLISDPDAHWIARNLKEGFPQ
jgi:cytochrome c55X